MLTLNDDIRAYEHLDIQPVPGQPGMYHVIDTEAPICLPMTLEHVRIWAAGMICSLFTSNGGQGPNAINIRNEKGRVIDQVVHQIVNL
jgi:hypothetical protein